VETGIVAEGGMSTAAAGAMAIGTTGISVWLAAIVSVPAGECSIPTSNVLLQAVIKRKTEIVDRMRIFMVPPKYNKFIRKSFFLKVYPKIPVEVAF
jgi:hypothetical protein